MPEEKFAEYFENGEFTKNPIGVRFDPGELFGCLADGEPEESLLPHPPGDPAPLGELPKN